MLLVLLSFVCCADTQNPTDNTTDNSFSESITESSTSVESSEITVSTEHSEMSDTSVPSLPEEESKTEVSIENKVLETVSSSISQEDDEESSSSTETDKPEQSSIPEVSEAPQVSNLEESEVEDIFEPEKEPEEPQESEIEQSVPPITEPEISEPFEPSESESSQDTSDGITVEIPDETGEFTEADHERIIAEVRAYCDSFQSEKGFTYVWDDSMEFSWELGFMGTPRIDRDGIDGVIETLKYHADEIYNVCTDPANGIPTDIMTYKVVQIYIDGIGGGIAYVLLYGS